MNRVSYQQPKRLRPAHLIMVRLRWLGYDNNEIAERVNYSHQQVCNVLASPEAQAIFDELTNATLDTTAEVSTEIQLAAPFAIRGLIESMSSPDERVAFMARREVAHMAGHAPVKRMQLSQATVVERKYDGLSEHELRTKLLEDLSTGNGPDGKPLN